MISSVKESIPTINVLLESDDMNFEFEFTGENETFPVPLPRLPSSSAPASPQYDITKDTNISQHSQVVSQNLIATEFIEDKDNDYKTKRIPKALKE